MSMITTATWVRRGVAAPFPTKYEIDEAEIGRISKLAQLQLEEAREDLHEARQDELDTINSKLHRGPGNEANGTTTDNTQGDDELKEYHLDDYDDEPIDENGDPHATFGNVRSLAYHTPNEKDPYLELPEGEDSDTEEREELQIYATDNLLCAGKVEDEVAHLEIYVYEDEADNLYVHHDIMLPAVPLCTELIDVPVGDANDGKTNANFIAVGTMEPDIELWDLDVVDSMYPNAILGEAGQSGGSEEPEKTKKRKKKKVAKRNTEFHVDAVLALSANRLHRNLLASGSADLTVKLWDLNTAKCAKSYSMHEGKVCALDWHPTESTVLLSGSYDQTVIASDMRAPDAKAPTWSVGSDVESLRWDPHDNNFFYVATEAGLVLRYDARAAPSSGPLSKPVWTLQAHDAAVSAFDVNPTIPGYLATGSDDKTVKLWNVDENKPSMIVSRNLEIGRVFSARFAPDPEVSFRLAVAGSKGSLQVWDTSTNAAIRNVFAEKTAIPDKGTNERLVRVNASSSESDEGDEENDIADHAQDGWESMDED
ncbi:MAG: hypothetical protein Q9160_004933 [Pyrenula sp. 1 TL-2023]